MSARSQREMGDDDSPRTDWDVQAGTLRAPADIQVLKQGDTFVNVDRLGEAGLSGGAEQGLFHRGTRHLSRWELLINGRRPLLLNSTMKEDNSLFVVQMTMPELVLDGAVLKQGTLHVLRSLLVSRGNLYEHLQLTNYSHHPVQLEVEYRFNSDFRDIFEVRGETRAGRGESLPPKITDTGVRFAYRGLDQELRQSLVSFDGYIVSLEKDACVMSVRLDRGGEASVEARVSCLQGRDRERKVAGYADAALDMEARIRREVSNRTEILTSNERFNSWIDRSYADLEMLVSDTAFGRYPYAGVPWFATPFGRDGIITALETLWVWPHLSRGVLAFLAATQATEIDPANEAEPGKIVHEMRDGEMAALGEVPFRRYYGTVDATPLFVVLAGQYYRRTGDIEFLEFIWPNIRRALDWIDQFGDIDGDGFVEYQRHNERGLINQCWKDSNDSIYHADGRDATGAVATCEVQGYVYEARLLAAELADVMEEPERAAELRQQASLLKQRFNSKFWVNSLGNYAIALDGDKEPCCILSSNTGHLLYNGIVTKERAGLVTEALAGPRFFNGWGIRTVAEAETRFNPMSYHNGSVWPHDTALCAAGMARYDYRGECARVIGGLFDAAQFNQLHRLPELFCGFKRMRGHAPTLYPVACSPQAWAAGSVFLLLQSILGIRFSPEKPQVRLEGPRLPEFLDWVRIRNLRVGDGSVDLALRRHPRDVGLNVERKEGDIQIVVIA